MVLDEQTLRNRKLLRRYTPVIPRASILSLPTSKMTTSGTTPLAPTSPVPQAENVHRDAEVTTIPIDKGALSKPMLQTANDLLNLTPQVTTTPTSVVEIDKPLAALPGLQTNLPADDETGGNPSPTVTNRVPRALRALQTYNSPGLKEEQPPATRLRRE